MGGDGLVVGRAVAITGRRKGQEGGDGWIRSMPFFILIIIYILCMLASLRETLSIISSA